MSRTDLATALTNFQETQNNYIYRHAILGITDFNDLCMVYKLFI
jgi:hypothetical protein